MHSGSIFGWALRDTVDDEEAGEGLLCGDKSQAELLLEGVEESGAGGVGGGPDGSPPPPSWPACPAPPDQAPSL